jgi:death-on-curing protein
MSSFVYLTFEQVAAGARHIIGHHAVLRDAGLLASAVIRPQTVAFGVEVYPTVHTKAAALLHSIVGNHPYVDGNKRMGWAVTEAFYVLNGHRMAPGTDDEAFDLVLDVAKGAEVGMEVSEIAKRLERLFRPA